MESRELHMRIADTPKCSIGVATVVGGNKEIYTCFVLGRPWLENKPFVSRIPKATYQCQKRAATEKISVEHIEILNVPGRSAILIHPLNRVEESEGCFGPGMWAQPHTEQEFVMGESRKALKKVLSLLPDLFTLKIA